MRKNMSWNCERLSHQGTSAPSIGGLAWHSKPHVPWDEWLLVTNKSSFGNPNFQHSWVRTPTSQNWEMCKECALCCFYFLAGGWALGAHIFVFFARFETVNKFFLMGVRGKRDGYCDTYNETSKGCKPTLFVLNLRLLSIC